MIRFEKNNTELQQDGAAPKRPVANMAQLTVFLTGLVLTITAYAVLNVLIQDMVREDMNRVIDDTHRAVDERLTDLEVSIRTAGTLAGLLYQKPDQEQARQIAESVPGIANFDRVVLVRSSNGGAQIIPIMQQEDEAPLSQTALVKIIQTVVGRPAAAGPKGIFVLTDLPGTEYWQKSSDPLIKQRLFAIASTITSGDGRYIGILIGLGSAGRVVDDHLLGNRLSLQRMAISDKDTGQRIFYMNRDLSASEEINFEQSGIARDVGIGGSVWQVSLMAGKDNRLQMLENTPWLMMIFGLILTITGTMYVRNNQRQSFRLGVMNRELAQKNYELSSEAAERERLNHSLRKAEREYRAIIDSVSDIIFEASVTGDILFLNDTWLKVTGFDEDQVLGRNLFDMLHPQDQEEQRTAFTLLVKGKKSAYRTFTRLRTSNGTFRAVELAMSMLRQDENRNMRVVGTITDVEERRRAERALSEAEKKYRTIVENAAGGIYQVTPEGQFLSANPAMARLLGFDTTEQMLREVLNAHDYLYVSARDRAVFIRDLETLGAVQNFETEVRTKSGARIWVNENARAVKDDDGNILYYEGSMEDVTSRKQATVSLREAKIQSDLANRAKSEFLTNMSHELRTPLNAIIGFAEIMKNQVLGPLGSKQYQEYAGDIHASGRRLLDIISEILDVSRIEAGERQINEGIVNTDKLIKSCIEFLTLKADEAKLKIVNMTDGKAPQIIGEELAIKQVLVNLIGNAIKYTPEGGRITIAYEIENNGRLRLSITDTGIGMEEHEIVKALSPFGQIETGFNRTGSGAGLGLTLAQSLMKLHEGKLEIFSQKGIGTTATIIFPAKRVAQDAGSTTAAAGSGAGVPRESGDGAGADRLLH